MPYNFHELETYDLDLNEISTHIRKNRFEFNHFDEWVDGWLNVFKNAEEDTLKQIKNLEEQGVPAFQIFVQEVHFGTFTVKLNFIIEGAKACVTQKLLPIIKVAATKFLNKEIRWSEEDGESTHDLDEPIYLAKLPLDSNHISFVLDGNHRLTQLLKQGTKEINSIEISPINIINEEVLLFTIEKAIYSFLVEGYTFQQHLKKGKVSHKDLFEASSIFNAFKELNN